ncbi:hypothetical protein BJ912DRAFT_943417 [Pholiota molesta]|nr:hypothetical protein BJ912DRAFT_943417 [Pholiota molesta]
MSAQNTYSANQVHSPYLQTQPAATEEDFKASYDDLIDDYSEPYAANARHQTFTVGTPNQTHHRGTSIPLSSKSVFTSKQSDDTHETSSYGYPPAVPKEIDTRVFGKRFYVATVLLFLRVREKNHAAAAQSGSDTDSNDATSRMPVYLSIFALAHVFQFVMAVDAVYARNTLQFLCLTIFNALFLLYAIIQIKEIRDAMANTSTGGVSNIPIDVLTTIIPIVISIAEIAYIGLGWKIYNEFGWKVYKFLGADRRIKKMYADYQIYECLVKFDVFFWAGFSVQFIWLVLQDTDWEYYNKWMMASFMSGCVGAMIYFIYKLIKVLLYKNSDQFKLVWKSLTVFSVIAIVLLFATFAYSVVVLRNFGRGLKDALTRKAQGFGVPVHRRAASTNLNRMSID